MPDSDTTSTGGHGTGGFLTKKYLGVPLIVWILIIVVLAYLYIKNRQNSQGGSPNQFPLITLPFMGGTPTVNVNTDADKTKHKKPPKGGGGGGHHHRHHPKDE